MIVYHICENRQFKLSIFHSILIHLQENSVGDRMDNISVIGIQSIKDTDGICRI